MFSQWPDNILIFSYHKNIYINNTGKVLFGAAAGVILGILFAPDKGSETREKLKQKGKEFSEGVKEKFGKYKEKADDILTGVHNWVLKTGNNIFYAVKKY